MAYPERQAIHRCTRSKHGRARRRSILTGFPRRKDARSRESAPETSEALGYNRWQPDCRCSEGTVRDELLPASQVSA